MPYPRRVIVYLRERGIPSSAVRIVPVSDPQLGSQAPIGFPPTPTGSLPILAVPPLEMRNSSIPADLEGWKLVRQALPIKVYLENQFALLDDWKVLPQPVYNMQTEFPNDAFHLANSIGYQLSTEGVLNCWNGVRLFGSGTGPISIPAASKESLKWVHRELAVIEKYLDPSSGTDNDFGGYAVRLATSSAAGPLFADIMLLSFLEMVDDLYCCFDELTLGDHRKRVEHSAAQGKDAYGRNVQDLGYYPHIRTFYELFRARTNAQRDSLQGEDVPEKVRGFGGKWADDIF